MFETQSHGLCFPILGIRHEKKAQGKVSPKFLLGNPFSMFMFLYPLSEVRSTYVDVLGICVLHNLRIWDTFDLDVPNAKVEVGAPCHQRHNLDVLAWKDDSVGFVLEMERLWFIVVP